MNILKNLIDWPISAITNAILGCADCEVAGITILVILPDKKLASVLYKRADGTLFDRLELVD